MTDRHPLHRELAGLLETRSRGASVGGVLSALWSAIDEALRPLVGPQGVVALFSRSLHLAAARHGWLHAIDGTDPRSGEADFPKLVPVFDARDRAEAVAGGAALLQSFCGLLASLVGAPATERLLRPVVFALADAAPRGLVRSDATTSSVRA